MRKLLALPLAVPALAACNEPPYAKVDHVTIAEIEASSVVAAIECLHEEGFIALDASGLARLEQSLALSDELVGSIARRTVTAVADHRDVPAAAAHVMLQQENSGYPVFEVTL